MGGLEIENGMGNGNRGNGQWGLNGKLEMEME